MLVLQRHKNESVIVRGSGETRITVVEIRGDQVRLGFEADISIQIDREEVRAAKDRDHAGPGGEGARHD